jgi:hypothetical protein
MDVDEPIVDDVEARGDDQPTSSTFDSTGIEKGRTPGNVFLIVETKQGRSSRKRKRETSSG